MEIEPLRSDLRRFLQKKGISRQFEKQVDLFRTNPRHPSLRTEILEPKKLKLYSFRVTKKYRAIFIFLGGGRAEIVDINDHYE